MKNKYAKLLSNTLIFTIGKFVSKLIVIFMLPLYTAYLSKGEYSTADLITNLCNLLIPIAGLGISEGIFRESASKSADKEKFFSCGILIFLVGSAGFLLLSPAILLLDQFKGYIWLIICYVLASNFHSVCAQYVCAIGRTKLFAGQGVLNTILTVLLNILFLIFCGWGIYGYILAIILADTLSTIFLIIAARLPRSFKFKKIDGATIKSMLKFSLPLIPSTIFWWVTSVSDRYLVAELVSEEVNGLYAVAYKVPTLLTYVVIIFNDAWKLSSVAESEDKQACTDFYSRVFKYYIAIMFMGGAVIAAFPKIFTAILFNESYSDAWVYIPILTVATVYTALDTFLGSAYFTVKKTMMSFITAMLGAVVNIVLNLILIPRSEFFGGAIGASIATFVSYFIVFVIRAASMHKFIPFKVYPIKLTINTVLLLSLAVFVTWFSEGLGIYGYIIGGVFMIIILLFNGRDIVMGAIDTLRSFRSKRSQGR